MKLLKSVYGHKQASREWHELINKTLTGLDLRRSNSDTILYTMNHPMYGICLILVYVNETMLISDSLEWVHSAKASIIPSGSS